MAYRDFAEAVAISTPASNTAAVVTLAADPKAQYVLRKILASYNATPTGGRLTIAYTPVGIGASRTIDIDVSAAGEHPLMLDIVSALNTVVTVTVAAGGASVTGKLNVIYNKQQVTL